MRNILVLDGHPDSTSLCAAAATRYADAAQAAGHCVTRVPVRGLVFDPVLRGGFHSGQPFEEQLAEQQRLILACDHLVIVSPNWWWSAPALLKAYIDRVFLPGFAIAYTDRFPKPLLRGRSARVIYTQDTPGLLGRLLRGDLFWRWFRTGVLAQCGFSPIRRLEFGGVEWSTPARRAAFLDRVAKLGARGI